MSEPRAGIAAREALRGAFDAALERVDAERSVHRALDEARDAFELTADVSVLALGKAAAGMARAARDRLGGAVTRGLVVTKEGHADGFDAWPVLECAHPVPDERCAAAGRSVLDFAAGVPDADTLLVLLSGGTSSLVATPVSGLSLDDLVSTHALLLASGAAIGDVNRVRRRLAAVAAGRLTAATRARRVRVLVISDVVGDDLTAIASGPCEPDPGGFAEALDVIARYGLGEALPAPVRAYLEEGLRTGARDAPSPDDPGFDRVTTRLVARNADAVEAAAAALTAAGARTVVLPTPLTGEAGVRGRQLAGLARSVRRNGPAHAQPTALVVGGETTVTLGDAPGRGGRSQELALAAAHVLGDASARASADRRIALLAAGTDGTDGPTDAAGGLVDAGTLDRIRRAGLDPGLALARHDAMPALDAAGDVVRTGPTGTNVMDLVLVWIDSSAS